jgi:DNA-binding response OmpR family regulator
VYLDDLFSKDDHRRHDQYHPFANYHSVVTEKRTTIASSGLTKINREERQKLSFDKHILIVDDDPDITLTFKKGLEAENDENNKTLFKVYTYNDPLEALSHFKPNFYDLLLVDINMPKMDGFGFSSKILELDVNVRICFMSSGQINQEALREQYPTLSYGCFITKPVTIQELIRKIRAEVD